MSFYNRCDQLGVPPAIGETASREHFTQPTWKSEWATTLVDDAASRGCLGVSWFNIEKPNDTTADMLLNSSANFIAAWQALVDTYVGV